DAVGSGLTKLQLLSCTLFLPSDESNTLIVDHCKTVFCLCGVPIAWHAHGLLNRKRLLLRGTGPLPRRHCATRLISTNTFRAPGPTIGGYL
ncbi:hypothetical protein HaLaN_27139, partial [Haematococcus lacustris]